MHSSLTNGIKNNLITKRDILICNDILGLSIYVTKGKTTQKQSDAVDVKLQTVELPPKIKNYYSNIEITADVMHVSNVLLLPSISQDIYYRIVGVVKNMTCPVLEHEICKILHSYVARGFNIVVTLVDK